MATSENPLRFIPVVERLVVKLALLVSIKDLYLARLGFERSIFRMRGESAITSCAIAGLIFLNDVNFIEHWPVTQV